MFQKVLVANRGVIARRIVRTLKRLGVRSVVVYSEADAGSLPTLEADEAVCIGGPRPADSYLNVASVLAAAHATRADALHPGYGFLSEDADFVDACAAAGVAFVGPTARQIRDFGRKHTARALARQEGIPVLPGSELLADVDDARRCAATIGYPVLLKSTAGGGGIGMRRCEGDSALVEAYGSVEHLARSAFGDGGLYLEKYVRVARHLEVQIFGDGRGNLVAFGERDCSAQRRHQKVLEETPAPGLSDGARRELSDHGLALGRAIGYQSAGTVEFVFDVEQEKVYFLEVNTRLQVEHGVTEEVAGVDLVEWMLRQASGELDLSTFVPSPRGVSMQARVYAEDPAKDFRPSPGLVTEARFPAAARIETWVEAGTTVPSTYDPMIAKVIVHAEDRPAAVFALERALAATRIAGIEHNAEYLRQVVASEDFKAGSIHTGWLADFAYRPRTIDVVDPGTQTTIQDYPGRVGYWDVGVPPSGPMDDYASRVANRLVGNDEGDALLELTLSGPTLRFNCDAMVAMAGADMAAELDGASVGAWRAVAVGAGSVLRLRGVQGAGCRGYLAVRGGFDVPTYLGSRSTFVLGGFGGHGGRALRQGDVLHIGAGAPSGGPMSRAPDALIPRYAPHWDVGVLYGPHAAPDFFTEAFLVRFFEATWKVHYNSNRLGIRLIGPTPEFSRLDGGEAGLHPSNIHDTEYAIGTINFTGDMPVILAKDGPSLGGFVCPVTIAKCELWKVGQLRPGDTIRFARMSFDEAVEAELAQDDAIATLGAAKARPGVHVAPPVAPSRRPVRPNEAILAALPGTTSRPAVVYRMAGDKYLLVEYGPPVLDLALRVRVHSLMACLREHPVDGVLELSPGVRSLQIHYDSRRLRLDALLFALERAEDALPGARDVAIPSRVLRLPLAFDASSTARAIAKYRQSVRDEAPWLPSNIEFIRRINGLATPDDVGATVFSASYLVLGLGDVYLGAPCAVPVDPRHRLVTTKYNPARTWTAEGEVGIGGVYMCIYGMESPGGYQLVGRTVPVWNTHRTTREFSAGKPWLLRFFDQVRFYPVPEQELLEFREDFLRGRSRLEIREEVFRMAEHLDFLDTNAGPLRSFADAQRRAFDEERERWRADGSASIPPAPSAAPPPSGVDVPAGGVRVDSPIAGSVWSVPVSSGERVAAGQRVAVIEAMKMEVSVEAPVAGVVTHVAVNTGAEVGAGQLLLVIGADA
jgi:urea carboxylase